MANITLNYKKWSQLLSAISAYKLFYGSHTNSDMVQLLSPVCTLAYALGKLYSKPIGDGFHVAIVGADCKEAINAGDAYRLLSTLLGVNELHIDLVGPDVYFDPIHNPQFCLRQGIGQNLRVTLHPMSIGEYVKTHTPDVIMLNHPGFEAHFTEWFIESELPFAFERGIEILGTSYGHDEAELDGAYLKAYGLIASEPLNNPYLVDYSKDANKLHDMDIAVRAGLMNWAGQVWRIEKKSKKNEELIQLLAELRKNDRFLASQLADPSSLPAIMDAKDSQGGEWVVVRFEPELIFYSREQAMIIAAENGDVLLEDVELDSTYLKNRDQKSIFQSMLISAIINRDYGHLIDAYIGDNFPRELFSFS